MFVSKKRYDELLERVINLENGLTRTQQRIMHLDSLDSYNKVRLENALYYTTVNKKPEKVDLSTLRSQIMNGIGSSKITIRQALDAICEHIGISFEYEPEPEREPHRGFKVVKKGKAGAKK